MVSVIVIFKDEASFLDQAITSVRDQGYDEWEILLVDDGSTDGSAEIARSHQAEDPERIRYLTHPHGENRGMSASRNRGLESARGEFVCFLDGDDAYLPERLARHVDVLRRTPDVAMVQSDHVRWRSWAGAPFGPDDDLTRPFFAVGDQLLSPPVGLLRILAVPYLVAGICNVTVRRGVALAVGGFADSFTSLYEDQVFVARVARDYPVYILQDYLALYRYHPASATGHVAQGGAAGARAADRHTSAYVDWLVGFLEGAQGTFASDLQRLARERREALAPSPARTARRAAAGLARTAAHQLLPGPLRTWLIRFDHRVETRAARRSYRRFADELGARSRTFRLPETSLRDRD
jgi:glycosyltransferase involved in cell wall biosynthesis